MQAVKRFGEQQFSEFLKQPAAAVAHGAVVALGDARKMFTQADGNNDGSLDVNEVSSLSSHFGMAPETMMRAIDTNGDGQVSLGEFLKWARGRDVVKDARRIFKQLDKDMSRGLSRSELKGFAKRLGVDLASIVAEDGELTEKQFLKFASKQGQAIKAKIKQYASSL